MDFPHLLSYLTALGHSHPDIQHVTEGDATEILDAENFECEYPLYWLETPDISIQGDTNSVKLQWATAISVLLKSTVNDYQSQRRAKIQSHTIIMTLLTKIVEDYANDVTCIQTIDIRGIGLDCIDQNSDNLIGYRLELPLTTSARYDTTGLQDTPFALPKITHDNGVLSSPTAHIGYMKEWGIWKDGKPTTSIDPTVTLGTGWQTCYVELSLKKGKHSLTTSIILRADGSINTFLYKNNPF